MRKDFAFLFYVNDWAGGTMGMNRIQRGGYLDLLLYQFNNTCFSLDEARGVLGDDFDIVWRVAERKFTLNSNNMYYNEKMQEVKENRATFCESRRTNRLGKTKKHKINTRKTSVKQVVNVNEDVLVLAVNEIKDEFIMNQEEQKLWDVLMKFISLETPELLQFKKPITPKEYLKLRGQFDSYEIEKTIRALANKTDAHKKYSSVYRTLLDWLKRNTQKV